MVKSELAALSLLLLLTGGAAMAADAPTPPVPPGAGKATTMTIQFRLEGRTLTATLEDSEAARDFLSLLPLTLTLTDYNSTEKISDLPRKLTTRGSPAGVDPGVGDLAYYAPWGKLAIFYRDFGYSAGLVRLGRLDGGVELLRSSGTLRVVIERGKR